MLPKDFEQANIRFTKPKNMTDEQCGDLMVYKGIDPNGMPVLISKWQPSKEDIEAINNGEGIWLQIVSEVMPPVAVFTESPFIELKLA